MGAGWFSNGIAQIGVVHKQGARLLIGNAFNDGALEVAINYGGVILPLHVHIDLVRSAVFILYQVAIGGGFTGIQAPARGIAPGTETLGIGGGKGKGTQGAGAILQRNQFGVAAAVNIIEADITTAP